MPRIFVARGQSGDRLGAAGQRRTVGHCAGDIYRGAPGFRPISRPYARPVIYLAAANTLEQCGQLLARVPEDETTANRPGGAAEQEQRPTRALRRFAR